MVIRDGRAIRDTTRWARTIPRRKASPLQPRMRPDQGLGPQPNTIVPLLLHMKGHVLGLKEGGALAQAPQ